MFDYLLNLDRAIVVAINSSWSPFLDNFFMAVSFKHNWNYFYILLILWIIFTRTFYFPSNRSQLGLAQRINSKMFVTVKNSCWLSIVLILSVLLTYFFTDSISHSILKDGLARLRPTYDPYIQDIIRAPMGRGGLYGFVSSHASNCCGFAVITALIIRKRLYTMLAIISCILICYSRIYLGRHFLGDIIGGAILGILCGLVVYWLLKIAVLNLFKKSFVQQQ